MKRIFFLICSTIILPQLHAHDELIGIPATNDDVLMRLLENHKLALATRQSWRPIQEEVRDTVVQIFAQHAETDLLQPYKTPAQLGVRGSGFFINEDGDIITNAHVVDNAIGIWIQIPSLGKQVIDVYVVGICPERDIALLRVAEKDLAVIRSELGMIPYLTLGDSDKVYRSDEVLALGYPLGQESLKSTTGVISGREKSMIQISAPINSGSSGGPSVNVAGEVIGINTSGITEAQNVGYIIPINDLKVILQDLNKVRLLRKPFWGAISENATETLTTFINNPLPGGNYIIDVVKDSPAYHAGIVSGDMIYEVNGYPVDLFGEMRLPWCEDKISVNNYISRLAIGEKIDIVLYRNGQRITTHATIDYPQPLPVRRVYPCYEEIDFEVFGGMVVMELTINHIKLLYNQAPALMRYTELKLQSEPLVVITHIFPNSQLFRSRVVLPGFIISEVNGHHVSSLCDFRTALADSVKTQYLTFKATDTVTKSSDNIFVVLPFMKLLEEEVMLSKVFHYQVSETIRALLAG